MDKILQYIAKETKGDCYSSYMYCHDGIAIPILDNEDKTKVSLMEYRETDHNENVRDLSQLAKKIQSSKPLFKFFLDGKRRTRKIDCIGYKKKSF